MLGKNSSLDIPYSCRDVHLPAAALANENTWIVTMAKTHSKSGTAVNKAAKTERYYMGYVPQNGKANPPPAINIKGRWLEQLGFYSGQALLVTVEHGKIVITPEWMI